jgi:hypothetical protein
MEILNYNKFELTFGHNYYVTFEQYCKEYDSLTRFLFYGGKYSFA